MCWADLLAGDAAAVPAAADCVTLADTLALAATRPLELAASECTACEEWALTLVLGRPDAGFRGPGVPAVGGLLWTERDTVVCVTVRLAGTPRPSH